MVVVNDPAKPATWDNVKKVLEIKFKGDKWTDNQARALRNESVKNKVDRVDESDCSCELEEEERQRETKRNIKQFSDNLLKYMKLIPFGPGRRVPMIP